MKLKLETSLDYFLFFIILVKIIFFFSAVGYLILSHSNNNKAKHIDPKLLKIKGYTEFVFTISMAILLLYHFNPYVTKISIDEESRILFFIFALIIILTANWNLFFTESPVYKLFVKSFT